MKVRRTAYLKKSLFFFLLGAVAYARDGGSVRGTVVDDSGLPIAGARVNVSPINGRPLATLVRYVETDREGRFLIDGLAWGDYGVFAMKEESGYADMSASFYSNDLFPRISLTPASPKSELLIQLGPKAGFISGRVIDEANDGPVPNARIKLTRAASPDKWLSSSMPSAYRILIPSSTDVLLEISAPGFKSWTPGHPIRLEPGAELHLNASLLPWRDPALHPSRFLVPTGYVGWVLLDYDVKDAEPVRLENDIKIFRFLANGTLRTSSTGPDRGAHDEYFYVSSDGSLRPIPTDYRNGGGMIWGQYEGTRNGVLAEYGFFVGTEQEFYRFQSRRTRPGPIVAP